MFNNVLSDTEVVPLGSMLVPESIRIRNPSREEGSHLTLDVAVLFSSNGNVIFHQPILVENGLDEGVATAGTTDDEIAPRSKWNTLSRKEFPCTSVSRDEVFGLDIPTFPVLGMVVNILFAVGTLPFEVVVDPHICQIMNRMI